MDSELRTPVAPARRGVAMFIVLGAILLVTLFGAVALTLAQRDQTLSGDLNDIKSRDEAALSGLQIAINRLTADPDSLVGIMNSFVQQSYVKKGKPDSVWISLDSNNTLHLLPNEPDWFSLSNLPGNQTAIKVQLVAVQHADTTSEVKLDSSAIYVTLRCLARGRHGDEKWVQAAYRIHGITGDNKNDTLFYTIPRHSFYMGGSLINNNLHLGAQGDVYVANGNSTYFNTGANQSIDGNFQFNDHLSLNSHLHIKGNMVVRGRLVTNAQGSLRVDGNLQIDSGFGAIGSDSTITVGGNAFINGPNGPTNLTRPGAWNSNKGIRVGGSLYLFHSNYATGLQSPKSLVVGVDAWIVRSGRITLGTNDSFFVGRDLIYGDNNPHSGDTTTGGILYKVGRSLIAGMNSDIRIPGGNIGDTIQVNGTINVNSGTLTVGGAALANGATGAISKAIVAPGAMHWRQVPTPAIFGIDTSLSKTAPADNPMDSVKVDAKHSLAVTNALVPFPGNILDGPRLNTIYDSLKTEKKLLNGYMCLIINNKTLTVTSSSTKFRGKMILVIEKSSLNVNQNWPASQTLDDIQVILVRHGGSLGQFGWNGTLAGILYWENPCGTNITLKTAGILHGAMILGTSLTTVTAPAPNYGYTSAELCAPTNRASFQTNTGDLSIIRDTTVFMDIGRNLPGVLAPAKDADGKPLTIQGTINVYYYTPRLRLVHDKPFFEPLGVFR